MDEEMKGQYRLVQNPYYQTVSDHPAVDIVIENDVPSKKTSTNIQQRLASQRPRGTRVDDTGTRIQVRGGRNYTSRKLHISREELFDDVVVRGLRADGLSTKLGVKNHKDGIGKLLFDLFQGDSRLPVIEEHYKTHRQKSNSAKTMFATMTHEELQFLKAETFPSRIDVQVRDYLMNAFSNQPEKLQSTVEVLTRVQQIFKVLTPHADFLSSHNFQTRGFFLDIILMTCSFLMQIIQDSDGNPEPASKVPNENTENPTPGSVEKLVKEAPNKTAAEILLSVGSDILDNSDKQAKSSSNETSKVQMEGGWTRVLNTQNLISENIGSTSGIQSVPKTTVMIEATEKSNTSTTEEWTTVEMVDSSGNSRYVLIKTNNTGGETFDTDKLWNMLQSQGVTLEDNQGIALDNQNNIKTTGNQPTDGGVRLVEVLPADDDNLVIDITKSEEHHMQTSTKLSLQLQDTSTNIVDSDPNDENLTDDEEINATDETLDTGQTDSRDITSMQGEENPNLKRESSDQDWQNIDEQHNRTINEMQANNSKRPKRSVKE